MKVFLATLFITFLTINTDYNKEFVGYLETAIKTNDYSNGGKFFEDNVIVYSFTTKEIDNLNSKDLLTVFNETFKGIKNVNHQIFFNINDDNQYVYTMEYYYMSGGALTKIEFFFIGDEDKIKKVYIP